MTKGKRVGFSPPIPGNTGIAVAGRATISGKLQCGVDQCAQRIQLDCLHSQVLAFDSWSSLYAMQDQSSHLIAAANKLMTQKEGHHWIQACWRSAGEDNAVQHQSQRLQRSPDPTASLLPIPIWLLAPLLRHASFYIRIERRKWCMEGGIT